MEIESIIIGFVGGAILGCILYYFLSKGKNVNRKEHDAVNVKLNETSTNLRLVEERLKSQSEQSQIIQVNTEKSFDERIKEFSRLLSEEKATNKSQQDELNSYRQKLAQLNAYHESLQEKLSKQNDEFREMQKMSQLQFEQLANKIFEEKSGKFTEFNKTNIEALLKPLNENIDNFKKKVEETYDKESKQRFSLEKEVKNLIDTTNKVSLEANNLATALKGQVKKQGDWGETILERILEMSGLEKNREYFVQENLKDEHGHNVRPDIIVRLPDNRNIILDSKVSMNAYVRYSESESKEEQEMYTTQHLIAINQHIDQLSAKKYNELTDSLDYVIMFIPIEPAYILAVQTDPGLWASAYGKKIVLISPTTLIATLKIVADLWKREQQSKNAKEIALQGARLYEKFVGFLESLDDVGKHISRTQESYHKAVSQLKEGKGNLLGQALKLKKLGVKSPKKLPPSMSSHEIDDEDEHELPSGVNETDEEERPSE